MPDTSREYKLSLCHDIHDHTDTEVLPQPIAQTGDYDIPTPDLCIDTGRKIHAFVIKRSNDERVSVRYEPHNPSADDINELLTFARAFPRTVVAHVGVRFDRRQLTIATLWPNAPNDRTAMRSAKNTADTDVRLTDADNLSFHKPDTTAWPSATTGDDAAYLIETIQHSGDDD